MIRLTKGQTQNIILTLTEKQLLTNPNYLFVFTNRSANTEVKFVRLNNTDISQYKERYNEFSIVTNTNFGSSLNGQYDYEVYEQASTTNTNPAGLNMIESGIMELVGTPFEFTEYSTTDTYKIRQ
jgi:hypothetical protein